MVVRAGAVGVVVASLLACGGIGGPAPTERAIALADTRVRDRYIDHDEVATPIGFGDSMTIGWAVYTPERPRTRVIEGEDYLVVPYTWESTSPIREDYYSINAIAWDSAGNELTDDVRKAKETCEGELPPEGEHPRPPHYAGARPNSTGHCDFLFKIDLANADNILFLIERDERFYSGQYIAHARKEPWVVDLGPATPE